MSSSNPSGKRCAKHPESEPDTCQRCGDFVCLSCLPVTDLVCEACLLSTLKQGLSKHDQRELLWQWPLVLLITAGFWFGFPLMFQEIALSTNEVYFIRVCGLIFMILTMFVARPLILKRRHKVLRQRLEQTEESFGVSSSELASRARRVTLTGKKIEIRLLLATAVFCFVMMGVGTIAMDRAPKLALAILGLFLFFALACLVMALQRWRRKPSLDEE